VSLLELDRPPIGPRDNLVVPHAVTRRALVTQVVSAGVLVFLPLALVAYAVVAYWGHGIGWFNLTLATVLYFATGHGLAMGFHRLFTHRSFVPSRWLKIVLATLGSLGVEGSLITWVAQHRRHHAASDRVGDPHSPLRYGRGFRAQAKGLLFAHVGWFFVPNPSHPERWCPDILADRDLVVISKLAPVWTAVSFLIPFFLGWAVTGTIDGAGSALLWAGVVRVFLLHHVTWGVNSIAHTFGSSPFRTKDNSKNVSILAIVSFGDSWHNAHHAFPTLARHGVDRRQIDTSAALIRLCERFGWATRVRWPVSSRLDVRRVTLASGADAPCAEPTGG
jgi:stearoyl-CoA desaturase (delta-9 desaturase)